MLQQVSDLAMILLLCDRWLVFLASCSPVEVTSLLVTLGKKAVTGRELPRVLTGVWAGKRRNSTGCAKKVELKGIGPGA